MVLYPLHALKTNKWIWPENFTFTNQILAYGTKRKIHDNTGDRIAQYTTKISLLFIKYLISRIEALSIKSNNCDRSKLNSKWPTDFQSFWKLLDQNVII